jgi:c-di-GMP-binding flagellar brake protein YcgR
MSGIERRRAKRVNVVIPVEVRDGHGFSIYSTRDISAGGVFFDRAIPHAVGSKVQLAFTLPGDMKAIRCAGEIVNVPDKKGYGMGIHFSDLSLDDSVKLEKFVEEEP